MTEMLVTVPPKPCINALAERVGIYPVEAIVREMAPERQVHFRSSD